MPDANEIKRHAKHGEKMTCVQTGFGGIDHKIKTGFATTEPMRVKVQQKFASPAQDRAKKPKQSRQFQLIHGTQLSVLGLGLWVVLRLDSVFGAMFTHA